MDNLHPSSCSQLFVPSHSNFIGQPHVLQNCGVTVVLRKVTPYISSSLSFTVSPDFKNASIECGEEKRIIQRPSKTFQYLINIS